MVFAADDLRVAGRGGCNRISGSFALEGDRLRFGHMASTRMSCPDGMTQEKRFVDTMALVAHFRIRGSQLELLYTTGAVLAVFADAGLNKILNRFFDRYQGQRWSTASIKRDEQRALLPTLFGRIRPHAGKRRSCFRFVLFNQFSANLDNRQFLAPISGCSGAAPGARWHRYAKELLKSLRYRRLEVIPTHLPISAVTSGGYAGRDCKTPSMST